VNMPGRSGLDLLKIIRNEERTRYWPVLMLTGNGDVGTKRSALELGATDFLNKPFDFVELTARLQNAIALKGFQDEIRRQNEILEQRVADRTLALEQSRRDIIFRLAKAAETRDSDTGNHIVRVGVVAQLLAEAVGLSAAAQQEILLTAPLHDVGKIGIGDEILRKPGPLTPEERAKMQEHCRIGAEILTEDLGEFLRKLGDVEDSNSGGNDLLQAAAKIALFHHERWDGTGYPHGVKGEQIPVEARIVAVADVYDALRSKRPYKSDFDPGKTLRIIQEGAGSQFDPRIVEVFESIYPRIEATLANLRDEETLEERAERAA
jgi:putative two-component system response regulator